MLILKPFLSFLHTEVFIAAKLIILDRTFYKPIQNIFFLLVYVFNGKIPLKAIK